MQIISDPNFDYPEQAIAISEINPGDVFRYATADYHDAITTNSFFMKIGVSGNIIDINVPVVNLSNGEITNIDVTTQVIVHSANVIVVTNT